MKKTIFTFTLLFAFVLGSIAQTTSGFEEFLLETDTFDNGGGAVVAFSSGNALFPIDYNVDFDSWSGWAISNRTDVTTPGFMNQYSAITGEGYLGSDNYAVAYVAGQNIINLRDEAVGEIVNGFYITNGTYPYLSMLEGDMFAKKFGGATGDDPDFFKVSIKKYLNGTLGQDSLDFYLADYRFEDNSQDYIIDDWAYVNLVPLGAVDSLVLTLSSSDNGQFGMNTPAYFCIDNFITSDGTLTAVNELLNPEQFQVYPNPASDYITISTKQITTGTLFLYNHLGALLQVEDLASDHIRLNIKHLPAGNYLVQVKSEAGIGVQKLVKK